MASVKVAVRVRPFNQREIDMEAKLIIQMKGKTTGILNCKANTRDESIRYKEFTFDHSYWSHDDTSQNFASQECVYQDLGTEVVDCAFQGYNACVFAYGQTGSGKTFTMMGSPDNQGLIPRICKALFERMSENSKRGTTHRVQVSYLEIYQERVADLLRGRDSTSLKVREHPKKGPYVQGLTTCLVTNYGHIQECMNRGNSIRTTAATNMNDVSSRSHAIFTITFVQAGYCDGVPSETVSKIHLVDLAGSERADATGATGQRLKEGAHINKSLVTLGSVISALAELSMVESSSSSSSTSMSSTNNGHNNRKSFFIPYRDSVLTWLLKDSLGGNSKTIMIAAISPADCNYGETLSTLRYANRAKNIINKPTVNEDPNVKLIRELRDEISKLKALMFSEQRSDMLAQLHEKEAREKELTEEWAGKWREAQAILKEQRALGLRKAGPGVVLDSDRPHLVAIDDDPLSTGVTLYHLKEGETTIGTGDSDIKQDIELKGSGMEPQHCTITFENGVATLIPQPGAYVMLNNMLIESPARLSQGCIIFLGKAHVFRFNDPAEAAELRKGERIHNLSRLSLLSWSTPDLAVSMENLPQPPDDEKTEIEIQRLNLEKEKEVFEKEQEAFEKRRRTLEEAQARLEAEKALMEKEHAEQTRQLQEDWRSLTNHQRHRELELREREKELILKREELERERHKIWGNINQECEQLQDFKTDVLIKLNDACQFITTHANEFTFPNPQAKRMFQDLIEKSQNNSLTEVESDMLVDILNNVSGPSLIQDLVNQHRKELADLQAELNRRVELLSERRKTMELIDKKLVDLVDEQAALNLTSDKDEDGSLNDLKQSLASRTQEELEKIEKKKQGLRLNLKKINSSSVTPSNGNDHHHPLNHSCETNYSSSTGTSTSCSSSTSGNTCGSSSEKLGGINGSEISTTAGAQNGGQNIGRNGGQSDNQDGGGGCNSSSLSSDTYHTAASMVCMSTPCSPISPIIASSTLLSIASSSCIIDGDNIDNNADRLMSDSGVELRPSPTASSSTTNNNNNCCRQVDESDLSSNEEYKGGVISDSQSTTSSIENRSPVSRNKRRRDYESLRRISQRIVNQKQSIIRGLDSGCPKSHLDAQIAVLQDMQRQYMSLKLNCRSVLSPAVEHPLQDDSNLDDDVSQQDIDSPSPVKPLHTGSTSALYSPPAQMQQQRLSQYVNSNLHRSMPSIVIESDQDSSIVTISGYCLRGAGTRTHYEYEVRITTCDERWTVLRRYTRFRDLHLAMKARYGEKVSAIPFPGKVLLFANTDSVARSRRRQLEFYLRRLIDVCRTAVPQCPLAHQQQITKAALVSFSPFFRKGVFENGKYGTS